MHFALIYVSRSRIPAYEIEREVASIVQCSLRKNRAMGVTGALVSTPLHFAQVLEGERQAVNSLMTCIQADARHRDIVVLTMETLPQRSFPRWSLAHIGNSNELEETIAVALEGVQQGAPSKAPWLLWDMMSELAYSQFKRDPSLST